MGTMLRSFPYAIMVLVTWLLFSEYYFFREQARRLLVLQDEYQTYIQAYKESSSFLKKKKSKEMVNDLCDETQALSAFNVVNRDALYLRDAAATFGKVHNVESVLCDVYDAYDGRYDVPTLRSAQKKQTSRRRQMSSIQSTFMSNPYHNFALRWPINRSQFWLSSKFGPRKKKDGVSWGFHHGIDLAALKGTEVRAAAKGIVIETSYSPKGYGKSIVLAHDKKRQIKTRYAHLDAMYVTKGQYVHEGQLIGRVGDTGFVHGKKDASHLHFELIEQNKRINPLRNLAGR